MKKINYFSRHSNFTRFFAAALIISAAFIFSTNVSAQTQLDTTFNAGVSEEQALVYTSATLPDGKVLVGGSFRIVNGVQQPFFVRLNADGTLDTTFNAGGTGANAVVYEIIVLPDGKFLIGGGFSVYNGVAIRGLARLNNDGTLDQSFNPGGAGTNGTVQGISLQSDGKILISGSNISTYNGVINKFSVVRVNPDGTLDTTFNSPFTSAVFVEEVDVQTDGKILVGGAFTLQSPTRTNIVRLNANGSIDTTFNPGGGGTDGGGVYAMTVQADGKILIGGDFTSYNFIFRSGFVRINPDGSLDSSFVTPDLSGSAVDYLTIQPDGKILAAGSFRAFGSFIYPLVRFNSNGSIDNSFQPIIADSYGYNVKLQSNGQIILTGYFNNFGGQPRNGIVRLNADGSIDNLFNASFFNLGTIYAIAQQTDGKILAAGLFRRANGSFNVNLARFNLDGSLDASFNTGSGASPNNSDFFNTVSAIAVQPDGKILVGGRFSAFNGVFSSGIVRLNTDGSVDTSFINNLNQNAPNNVFDIAVLPDNKILIGGGVFVDNGQFKSIRRLNSNGSLDNTFNSTGADANSNVNRIIRQPNGKILIGGAFTTYNGTSRNRIARLNVDGTLDTAFNPGTGFNSLVIDIALQSDGKILAGGSFTTFNGVARNRVARLNPDGSLDTSFVNSTGANSSVNSIALGAGGKIFIGGFFTTYDGFSSNRLARLNSDGGFDSSFVSGFDGNSLFSVRKLLIESDGRLLVGGTFTNYSGAAQNNLLRLETLSATYSVAGRIIDTKGVGISGAAVKLTDSNGVSTTVITDSLGYYRFDAVNAGQTFTISVSAKRNRFNPSSKIITVRGDIDNLNFISSRI